MKNLLFSKYLRVRERNGIVAIFHVLHPDPVYCSITHWNEIETGIRNNSRLPMGQLLKNLKDKKLLVESSADDQKDLEYAREELNKKLDQTTILYLMMTLECNLSCKYCPFSCKDNINEKIKLSKENAISGIDLWKRHLKDKHDPTQQYYIIFYGGEPLLNKEIIKAVVHHAKTMISSGELPSNIDFLIATNGILFDEEMIGLCRANNIKVTIPIDGPEQINDTLRVDCEGKGTYTRTIAVIESLVKNGITTFASVSITPYNTEYISKYSSFLRDFGIKEFGFNLLKGPQLLDLVGNDGLESYYRIAARGIIQNYRDSGERCIEYQMEKKVEAFEEKKFFPVDCTCYGNQIVILPDGQVSNCPFFRIPLGHIKSICEDFRIWNHPIIQEWRKRFPLNQERLENFDAKALCGAGCAWSCWKTTGDLHAIDKGSLALGEEALNELIWSRYKSMEIF